MKLLIVIPTYNSEKNLQRTLDSIYVQNAEYKILAVDDNSTDNTQIILAKNKIHTIIKNKHLSRGAGLSRQLGLEYAVNHGFKYIYWFDSDDLMLKNNLKVKCELLELNRSLDFVISPQQRVSSDLAMKGSVNNLHTENPILHDYYIGKVAFYSQSTIWRLKSVIDKKLTWNNSSIDDWDFNMQALRSGLKFEIIPEVLVWYVWNNDSVMRRHQALKFWENYTDLKYKRKWFFNVTITREIEEHYKSKIFRILKKSKNPFLTLYSIKLLIEYYLRK